MDGDLLRSQRRVRAATPVGPHLIELHGRTDEWGGTDDNRLKLLLAIIDAIRAKIPDISR